MAAGQSLDVVLPVAARAPAMPRVSVANARNQIVDVLARDNSSFALRATDQHWAASLALDINQCVHDSVPDSTLAKDTFAWKEWMRHCDKFNTVAWRPDRNDLDSVGRARERFLFDSFLIEDYKRMVRNKPTAKPRSAVNNLLAVKRVFRRGGVMPTETPNTNTILRGLLNRYVLLHGAEVLTPKRVEPLINSDMQGIFGVRDGVRCGSVTVHWSSPRFRSFRAYLSTARIAAYRKAGVLCVNSGDFDLRSASRGHLSWRYRGQMRTHLADGELRSLRPGDCAVITPVPVKNDPFAEFFGNHPIWLPYDSADSLQCGLLARRSGARVPGPRGAVAALPVVPDGRRRRATHPKHGRHLASRTRGRRFRGYTRSAAVAPQPSCLCCRFRTACSWLAAHGILLYLYVPEFERKQHYFADNSVGWHLATNSFHQHVRLVYEDIAHIPFFRKNISIRYQNMRYNDVRRFSCQKSIRTQTAHFADNSDGWHLATNAFHQHVRLLMEMSPHTFF